MCAFTTNEDWTNPETGGDWWAKADVKAITSTDWGETWSPSFVVASQRNLTQPRHCSWSGLIRLRDESLLCIFNDGPAGLVDGKSVIEEAKSVIINYGLGVETPLIEDHFDRLNLDWTPFVWGLLGTWEMTTVANYGNVFRGIALSIYEPAHAFRGDTAWTDYRVQADVRLEATTATAGVCLRDAEYYWVGRRFYECYLKLDKGQGSFDFRRRVWDWGNSSWWWEYYTTTTVTVSNPNDWHTIKVEAVGGTFHCYLDGVWRFRVPATYWTDGMVGLRVDKGSASFDNVEVVDRR